MPIFLRLFSSCIPFWTCSSLLIFSQQRHIHVFKYSPQHLALSLSLSHTHTHTLITLSLLLAFETQTFPPTIWYSPYIPIFPNPDLLKFNHMVPRFVNYLIQGWRKYGSWHLLLSQCFVPHLCPISVSTLWRTCVYIWLCTDCIRITVATK